MTNFNLRGLAISQIISNRNFLVWSAFADKFENDSAICLNYSAPRDNIRVSDQQAILFMKMACKSNLQIETAALNMPSDCS